MRNNKSTSINSFRKFCLHILIVFIFSIISIHSAFPHQNITYYLEIDEENWNSFSVTITIKNNHFESLFCGFPESYYGLFNDHTYCCEASNFNVLGEYGEKLPFEQIDLKKWLVNANDNDFIVISYKIKGPSDNILGECIDRNFARVDGGTIFMFIRELKNFPIHLAVRVPHGWKLATALSPTIQPFEYYVENYKQLIQFPLYMGTFQDIYFAIKNRTCYVVIDGKQTTNLTKLNVLIPKIVTNQINLFKDIPFERYLFIFKVFSGYRQISSKAYVNTSIIYLTHNSVQNNLPAIVREAASNFFQMWNGNRFYPDAMEGERQNENPNTSSLWFCYGVSDYYGCLNLVRSKLWSEENFIDYHIKLINRILCRSDDQMPAITTLCSQIIKYDSENTMEYIRLKGQLLGLLLDLKIRELTFNKSNLDDVMYFMNKWFGDKKIGYHDEDILRAICAVTRADLTSFFDLYINGSVEWPFSEIFKTAGVFLESKTDTLPDLGRLVISDRGNIVTEISDQGPMSIAGLKIGDKLISINNQRIHYPKQLEQMTDSLEVGQEIDISIQRDGLLLMLIAKVAGKVGKVVSLINLEPQTEQQQIVRKTWLSPQIQ